MVSQNLGSDRDFLIPQAELFGQFPDLDGDGIVQTIDLQQLDQEIFGLWIVRPKVVGDG